MTSARTTIERFLQQTITDMVNATRAMRECPELARYLWKRSWCASGRIPLAALPELCRMVKEHDENGIDSYMLELARNVFGEIVDKTADAFPRRATILRQAKKAHEEHIYELSVPAWLMQADGICHDLLDRFLFGKTKAKPGQAKEYVGGLWADWQHNWTFEFFLEPLGVKEGILSGFSVGQSVPELSRHAVLHGYDVDYATEVNSLKCVLLIGYVVSAAEQYYSCKEHREKVKALYAHLAEKEI